MNMIKMAVGAVLVAGCAQGLSGAVFDDVDYWLRPYDRDGNGYITSTTGGALETEFVNVKTAAGGTSEDLNKFRVFGPANGLKVESATVRIPSTGRSRTGVNCFKFENHESIDGATTNSYPTVMRSNEQALKDKFGSYSNYTLLMRFKRDASSESTRFFKRNPTPFSFFYSSTHAGVRLRLTASDNTDESSRVVKAEYYDGSSAKSLDSGCKATVGEWTDVALVSSQDGKKLDLYVMVGDMPSSNGIAHVTATISGDSSLAPNTAAYLLLGGTEAFGTAQTPSKLSAWDCFYGCIQHFATWSRALSEEEVAEAFAETSPDIFRVGLADGSTDEFAAGSDATTASVETGDWQLLPSGLASGASQSFTFSLDATNAALPQLFRFVPTASTAAGTVQVQLDAVTIGEETVESGRVATWKLEADALTVGAHTLTLTRTDAGVGTLTWDQLTLGGSWLLGEQDGGYAEFKDKGIADYRVSSGNWPTLKRSVSSYSDANRQLTLRFDVPADVLASGKRLSYKTVFLNTHKYVASNDKSVTMTVNGHEIGRAHPQFSKDTPFEAKIPNKYLLSGANVLTLSLDAKGGEETTDYWTFFDYHRLCVLDAAPGLMLIFK